MPSASVIIVVGLIALGLDGFLNHRRDFTFELLFLQLGGAVHFIFAEHAKHFIVEFW